MKKDKPITLTGKQRDRLWHAMEYAQGLIEGTSHFENLQLRVEAKAASVVELGACMDVLFKGGK